MPHPLVLGLFDDPAAAARAARDLRAAGVPRARVSIVARTHDEEVQLASASGASPGSEIEDSPTASHLGELSAHFLAAIALVMPGIGPIVADGPLAAGLGEAAGHVAGGVGRALEKAGLTPADAGAWEARIERGAILVGAHVATPEAGKARELLAHAGAHPVAQGTWPND